MSEPSTPRIHSVRAGETLGGIARQHGVSLQALLHANPDITNPDVIRVGQRIRIPTDQGTSPPDGGVSPGVVHGDANRLLLAFQPAGASDATARQDRLPQHSITGVRASETMAQTDRQRVMQHKEKFETAGRLFGLPPALLAAIASRESRGGAALDQRGEGDHGHGFGLMQVDNRNPFEVVRDGGPFGQPHINQATKVLQDKLATVRMKLPSLTPVQQLQAAVSRYNGGRGLPPPDSDRGTTGGDYMNDVWARARFYAQTETWSDTGSTAAASAAVSPTTAALLSRLSEPPPGGTSTFVAAPTLEAVRSGNTALQRGQQGEAVLHVQQLLGIDADRKFGKDTESAVLHFQNTHTAEVAPDPTGTVGRATLLAMERESTAALSALTMIDARQKTGNLHPEFRRRLGLMAAALTRRDLHATIVEGMRTFAQQDAIHAQGRMSLAEVNRLRAAAGLGAIAASENVERTQKRGGFSNHNYGLAVDVYPVINGRLFTDVPGDRQLTARFRETQEAIAEEAERVGLTWGGRWERLRDTPHVQFFPLNILRPEECHSIFRAHDNDMTAVWAAATRLLTENV